jgi:hypothetical protein
MNLDLKQFRKKERMLMVNGGPVVEKNTGSQCMVVSLVSWCVCD